MGKNHEFLNELSKDQLLALLKELFSEDTSLAEKVRKIITKDDAKLKQERETQKAAEKYEELWTEIVCTVNEIDELGGGPEEDYDNASNKINDIVEIFKKGNLENDLRKEFITDCLESYFGGPYGYGLEDSFMDAVFGICKTTDDWTYVADELKKHASSDDSSYKIHLILKIYRNHLKDDEKYLKLRYENLKNGLDYADLLSYYVDKGELQKAVETAKDGIAKAEYNKEKLYEFLLSQPTNHETKFSLMLELFRDSPSMTRYLEIEKHCKTEQWKDVSAGLYSFVKEKRSEQLAAKIDFHHERYAAILYLARKELEEYDNTYSSDRWSIRLEPYFPEEILKLYQKCIERHIARKSKGYWLAKIYCQGTKRILKNILKKDSEWEKYITALRAKYPKLPALQRELKEL